MMNPDIYGQLMKGLGQAGVDWKWTIDDDFVVPVATKKKKTDVPQSDLSNDDQKKIKTVMSYSASCSSSTV